MSIEMDEVKYWKPRFERWLKSDKCESIANELYDTDIAIISKIMNAEKDEDCNWLVWKNCDYVLEHIRKIATKLKF